MTPKRGLKHKKNTGIETDKDGTVLDILDDEKPDDDSEICGNDEWVKSGKRFHADVGRLLDYKRDQDTKKILEQLAQRTAVSFIAAGKIAQKSGRGISFERETIHQQNILHLWASGIGKADATTAWESEKQEIDLLTPLWQVFIKNGVEKYVNEPCGFTWRTPLHYCCVCPSITAAKLLLSVKKPTSTYGIVMV